MYKEESPACDGDDVRSPTVRQAASRLVVTEHAELRVVAFTEIGSSHTHLAIVHGRVAAQAGVPIYLRRSSAAEASIEELARASALLCAHERGVLVCLESDERADGEREYVIAADILRELRVRSVRLPSAPPEGAP